MEFVIREAREADMPQVLDLINELAVFENEPDAVQVDVADLVEHGFGETKRFSCLVGEHKGSVVGMALFYPRYSTWKGPALHLEDLIVKKAFRGGGLGSALLDAVIQYGARQGVRRINWEVLDWNEPAIKLYEGKGAVVMDGWRVVHLNEKAIQKYGR